MQLIVFRHGEAGPAGPGQRDRDRVLTERGREEFTATAAWWAGVLLRPEQILCSPYLRARQTAELLADAIGAAPGRTPESAPPIEIQPGLEPEDDPQALQASLPEAEVLVLVSHMPLVGELCGRLATGSSTACMGTAPGQGHWFELHHPSAAYGWLQASLSIEALMRVLGQDSEATDP